MGSRRGWMPHLARARAPARYRVRAHNARALRARAPARGDKPLSCSRIRLLDEGSSRISVSPVVDTGSSSMDTGSSSMGHRWMTDPRSVIHRSTTDQPPIGIPQIQGTPPARVIHRCSALNRYVYSLTCSLPAVAQSTINIEYWIP